MKAIIELKETNKSYYELGLSTLTSGFYLTTDEKIVFMSGGFSTVFNVHDYIVELIPDHKPSMTLNEISASEEETHGTVPAWFVLELVKELNK